MATRKRGKAARAGGALSAARTREVSTITAADVEDARVAFRRDAPRSFRDLLDAAPEADTLEPPTPPVR
jgi:hypothetical protein